MIDLDPVSWWYKNIPFWFMRFEQTGKFLKKAAADIYSLQEALPYQVASIIKALPNHQVYGDPLFTDAILLINRDRFAVRASGTHWLSKRPSVAYSSDFGNPIPRIAVWAVVHHLLTGQKFLVVSTHLDARKSVRSKMAESLRRDIQKIARDLPVLWMGDFNIQPGQKGYSHIVSKNRFSNSSDCAEKPVANVASYEDRLVDHIFFSRDFPKDCGSWKIVPAVYDRVRLSDHEAVMADFSITNDYNNLAMAL
jgi:endonuclease/exonuclease/phosphatase family metal-dependent hydrolase